MVALVGPGKPVAVRAVLLGERIDLKGFDSTQGVAANPLIFGVNPLQEVGVLDQLAPYVGQPYPKRETEDARLRVEPGADEGIGGGEIVIQDGTVERFQVIADVLAKSVVLAYYEASLAGVFDAVEPFAAGLRQRWGRIPRGRDLLRYIGDTLLIQHKMVGRVEVGEKPDVMWDRPELSRLFAKLEDEYELAERRRAIERKLELISKTVGTLLDLLQNKRSLRVEWYIVLLIVLEIAITLFQMAGAGIRP
jgi:uncharacterized Rmd1/YagE family protein